MSQMLFSLTHNNYRKKSTDEAMTEILRRSAERERFYTLLVKLVAVVMRKRLRMVLENPWSEQTYLKANFLKAPDIVDNNRMERGDYYKKPTAYWFWNCEPTHGKTEQNDKRQKLIIKSRMGAQAGVCSEERSMISPDYARNFICDFILGKKQNIGQLCLF